MPELTYCTSGGTVTGTVTIDSMKICNLFKYSLNQFNVLIVSAPPIVSVVTRLSLCNDESEDKDHWLHQSNVRNDIFETTQSHNMPIASVINRPLSNQQQIMNSVPGLNNESTSGVSGSSPLTLSNKEQFYYNRSEPGIAQSHGNYSMTAFTTAAVTTISTVTLASSSIQTSTTNYLSTSPCEIFPLTSDILDITSAAVAANGNDLSQNIINTGK